MAGEPLVGGLGALLVQPLQIGPLGVEPAALAQREDRFIGTDPMQPERAEAPEQRLGAGVR